MAQNMKLSIIIQGGGNILVEVNTEETFEEFQQKVFREHNVCITIEEFQLFFENLTSNDNLFQCLKENLNIGDDLIDAENAPIYELNLFRDIKSEHNNTTIEDNSIENDSTSHFDNEQNLDASLMVLNQEQGTEFAILNPSIFETSDFSENKKEQITLYGENHDFNQFEITMNNGNQKNENYNYLDIETKLAAMHDCEEENLTDVCRLCAKNITEGKKTEIYNEKKLNEKINSLLPILIIREDGLPQQICMICTEKFTNYYKFVEVVMDADKQLRQKFLKENNQKLSSGISESPAVNKPKNIKTGAESDDFVTEYLDSETNEKNNHCRYCDLIIENIDEASEHSALEHSIDDLYACVFCDLGFHEQNFLELHIKMEHRKLFFKQFQCKVCLKKYDTQLLLVRHTCAKNTSDIRCDICNNTFPSKARLTFHKQFHLKDARPLFCTKCRISFKKEEEFFNHDNLKHRDGQTSKNNATTIKTSKPFQCHVCGKNMSKSSRLKRHLLTHDSSLDQRDILICEICKEAFADNGSAEFHKMCLHSTKKNCIKFISTDKVYRCEFCDKCYSTPQALNEHRSSHTGPTPYSCYICKAQFSSYSRCTTHKTTHGVTKDAVDKDDFSVEKHFLCEHCGNSYLHWTYLGLHRRLKHSETNQVHKCTYCKLQFPNSWGLAYHKKTKHSIENYKCNECNKVLINEHCLKLHHLTKHSNSKRANQCVICGKIFQYETSLEAHMKVHKDLKEFKCILCPKIFLNLGALTNHFAEHKARKFVFPNEPNSCLYTHTDRPYTCDVCGLSFRRQFTLKNHKQKHAEASVEGSFVLMVDMKEDDQTEQDKTPTEPQTPQIIDQKNQQVDINFTEESVTPNLIDMGNGSFLQVQGNTFNIGGEQYILVDQKPTNRNQEFDMMVDEILQGEETNQNLDTNNGIMYVDDNFLINQNEIQPELIFDKTVQPGTTYVIGGNEFLIQPDEQTF